MKILVWIYTRSPANVDCTLVVIDLKLVLYKKHSKFITKMESDQILKHWLIVVERDVLRGVRLSFDEK